MKMRFALIDGERIEPNKGLKGICPLCENPVVAKCGTQRIHHWAHVANKGCDKWWESKTEWHIIWQNRFPKDWQEFPLRDKQTNERHFADVRTHHGLVIEFQHSDIAPEERTVREKFYQTMIWVVDGIYRNRHLRFLKYFRECLIKTQKEEFYIVNSPEKCFPSAWVNSSVPVVFDFQGQIAPDCLWYIFSGRAEGYAVVARISRENFVPMLLANPRYFAFPDNEAIDIVADSIKEINSMPQRQLKRHAQYHGFAAYIYRKKYGI